MIHLFKKMLYAHSGATAIEYGLITALISISSITVMTTTGTNLQSTFECISNIIASRDCAGGTYSEGITSANGWNGEIPVKAGETYEITFDDNMQYTVWNNAQRWFDPTHGIGAVITDNKLSETNIRYITGLNRTGNNIASISSFNNIEFHENGKLTITAQNDGFLNIGINDSNGNDNWVSYDGGTTTTKDMKYTVTRIN